MSETNIPSVLLNLYPPGSLEKRAVTILYQKNDKKFHAFAESGGATAILKVFQEIEKRDLLTKTLRDRVNYATTCKSMPPETRALCSQFMQTRIQTFFRSGGHRIDLMKALQTNASLQARIHILNEQDRFFSHPNTTLPSKVFYLLKGLPFWFRRTTQLESETAELAKKIPTWYINALVIADLSRLARLEKMGAPFTFKLEHLQQIEQLSDKKRKKVLEVLLQEKKVTQDELTSYARQRQYNNTLKTLNLYFGVIPN